MHLTPELLSQTLALPDEDRAALAHHLLDSLPPGFDDEQPDLEEVLLGRLERVDSGNYTSNDAKEALAEMRKKLEKRRQS